MLFAGEFTVHRQNHRKSPSNGPRAATPRIWWGDNVDNECGSCACVLIEGKVEMGNAAILDDEDVAAG